MTTIPNMGNPFHVLLHALPYDELRKIRAVAADVRLGWINENLVNRADKLQSAIDAIDNEVAHRCRA